MFQLIYHFAWRQVIFSHSNSNFYLFAASSLQPVHALLPSFLHSFLLSLSLMMMVLVIRHLAGLLPLC